MPLILVGIGVVIGLVLRRMQADRALADAIAWKARAASCERDRRTVESPAMAADEPIIPLPELEPVYGPGFVIVDDE